LTGEPGPHRPERQDRGDRTIEEQPRRARPAAQA
jgi:hypothetical protein